MSDTFKGPLFIVGLSRSGTKLFRDLLNRNTRIYVPNIETHFIPKVLLRNETDLKKLYDEIEKSLFVKRFPDKNWPKYEVLDKLVPLESPSHLIEAVLKYYGMDSIESEWDQDLIWGDKTPSYLRHLDILKKHFPRCKFIHVIRDPRDRALSVQKTWGKSMNRATELWRREIQESREWVSRKDCYKEIKYEDLISNTKVELLSICDFLGVDFSDNMLGLGKPSEKFGNTSKSLKVSVTNTRKYLKENKTEMKRIEEIAYPMMEKLGYEISYAQHYKPLSNMSMNWIKLIDFVKFKANVKIKGY